VGIEFGVTRERIRQVQNIALEKLRRALKRLDNPAVQARFRAPMNDEIGDN
jgi:RNA polymerase primary sigma factor